MPAPADSIPLSVDQPVLERCFTVAPLVVVGTLEEDGTHDLAPKHMATPLGWDNHFGFVCTPAHATYRNAVRSGAFTVSFPRPDQVLLASLSAAPRCTDGSKPALAALAVEPARAVAGVVLADAYLALECELERVVDGFGSASLVAGRIVAARASPAALREPDVDEQEQLAAEPLLAYLSPGRWARVAHSYSFPYHAGFSR